MKQLPKTVWGNFGVGLTGRLVSQSLSFFIVVYLARILGPADYGNISLVLAIISYFNLLATFGLPTIGMREVARVPNDSLDTVRIIFSLRVWLAGISYLLLFVYGYFFVSDTHLFYLLLLYGLTIFSASWLLDWVFVGMEDLRSLAVANVLGSLFSCIFIFLLVKNVTDIYFIPAVSFSGSVLTCLYLLYLYRKVQSIHLSFNIPRFRNLLRLSMPFAITGLFDQVYGNLDMILLGYMVGSEEVGYYSVAYKIVFVLCGIIGIYFQSTFPVMIRLYETNNHSVGEFLKQNINSALYFLLPLVTGGSILAHSIVETFFGKAYAQSGTPFILLLYYVFFMALSVILANLLLSAKRDKVYFSTLTLGAFVNVTANIVLIPLWQSTGSAAAMVIAEVVIFFCYLFKVKSLHKDTWFEKKLLFISLVSSGVMALCIYWLQQMFQVNVGFIIVAGATIYIGISWPFCSKFIRRKHTA